MTGAEEKALFGGIGGTRFEAWLAEQQAEATKYLMSASDPVALHRAQGKALFIEEIKKLLAVAKKM